MNWANVATATPGLRDLLLGMTVGELVALIAALAVLGGVLLKAGKFIRRTTHFLDDWIGEPERKGQPARPGVMERLQTLEQLQNNGGSTMKDAVDRIEEKISTLGHRLESHVAQANEVHLQAAVADQEMWKAIEAIAIHQGEQAPPHAEVKPEPPYKDPGD